MTNTQRIQALEDKVKKLELIAHLAQLKGGYYVCGCLEIMQGNRMHVHPNEPLETPMIEMNTPFATSSLKITLK